MGLVKYFVSCLALSLLAGGVGAVSRAGLPPGAEILRNASNGTLKQLKGTNLSALLEQRDPVFRAKLEAGQWGPASIYFLKSLGSLTGLEDADREFLEKSVDCDDLGLRHVRLAQQYRGLPVWDTSVIVHWNLQHEVYLVEGDYMPTPIGLGVQPKLDSAGALRQAERASARACPDCRPELGIWRGRGAAPHLAYRMRLPQGLAKVMVLVLDGDSGRVLEQMLAPR